jgi:hypothetical protein
MLRRRAPSRARRARIRRRYDLAMRGEATRYRRWTAVLLVTAATFLLTSAAAMAATVSLFPVPTPDAGLSSIAEGPNGNLWFTESNDADVNTTP